MARDFLLVGDEQAIRAGLANHPNLAQHAEIVHAPEVVGSSEKPTQAIRRAKTTSMGIAIDLVKQGARRRRGLQREYGGDDGDGKAVAPDAARDRSSRARRVAADRWARPTW